MNWYKKSKILKEASITVPQKVYSDIINYVEIQVLKYAKNKRIITPIRKFELDFTDTNFEFLNVLNTSIIIKIGKASRQGGNGLFKIGDDGPEIFVNVNFKLPQILTTLEHEIFHFIQWLIGIHTTLKKKERMTEQEKEEELSNLKTDEAQAKFYKDITDNLGGLPSKHLLDKSLTPYGYLKQSPSQKVTHSNRPVELYSNAVSVIRSLQYVYSFLKNKISKKDFFIIVTNLSQNETFNSIYTYNKYITTDIITDLFNKLNPLKNIKNKNPKLYNHIINKIYNEFVNKAADIDYTKEEVLDEIKRKEIDEN